jgi:hypothetical protein
MGTRFGHKKKTPEESRVLEVHCMDFETITFIPVLSFSTMHNEICQGPKKSPKKEWWSQCPFLTTNVSHAR